MKPRILLIDDDASVREVDSYYLTQRGYRVIKAQSGREALGILEKTKVDLVLLDILMPEMDGIECLKQIRKLCPKIPVIMVTCVDKLDIAQQSLELGALDYITKPLGYQALENSISFYLFMDKQERGKK